MSPHRIHFLNALATIPVPSKLLRGVSVLQVAANGLTTSVMLSLSEDKFTIRLVSTNRGFFRASSKDNAVDIGEISRIQRGQSTQQFEFAKKNLSKPSIVGRTGSTTSSVAPEVSLDPKRSFSFIMRGSQTIDLMASSYEIRNELCDALDRLILAYHRAKVRVAHDVQLLRYVWLNLDTNAVNAHQMMRVLQEINYEIKQKELNASLDKFGKVIGLDRAQRRKGYNFEQTAVFLHKLKRDSWMVKPVNVIWNELFGECMNNGKLRTTVSDKTFLERFLQGKQGESQATLLDVRKLFRKLHDMEVAHNSAQGDWSRITKEQFEAYLFSEENEAFDPVKEQFDKADMEQPLSQYWINSSHNTYLIGDQYTSHSSVEMYSNALYRGCRCLELDVWDGGKTERGTPIPVVWHGVSLLSLVHSVVTLCLCHLLAHDAFYLFLSRSTP